MRVARELDRLLGERGNPTTIVSDNGSELSSKAILCDGPTITRWLDTRTVIASCDEAILKQVKGSASDSRRTSSVVHTISE